jgi:hypothetical protein
MGDEEKTWLLYADAASSLTRLYQHGSHQKRDGFNAGYKAALEATLQFTVKQCTERQSNAVPAATLINYILPQLQRDAQAAPERESRPPAPAATPTAPAAPHASAQHVPQASSSLLNHPAQAAAQQQGFASTGPQLGAQDDTHDSGDAHQLGWPAVTGADDALAGGAQGGFGVGQLSLQPRKRNTEAADWMGTDGGHVDGALLQSGQLPPEWPPAWKRGRH